MSTSEPSPPRPPERLVLPDGSAIAYHKTPGTAPGIIFLGGFMSDMAGTKALGLQAMAERSGWAYLRFDYLGHGASSGRFEEGTIGRWAEDAIAVLDHLTEGPQILVGSSMGGWIMLLAALARPERVAGMIGIAAAPDFTEDLMWAKYPPEVRAMLACGGIYREPSDYGEESSIITMQLIEDGRRHLLLREPIPITCPVRLIHGMEDPDVPWDVATALAARLKGNDVEITLVKGAGHRLSEPADLARLIAAIDALSDLVMRT